MGLDNLDQNYHDPNFEGDNHPWGDNKDYQKWEDYNKLLKSGMFWEFHPELSGEWEKDKELYMKTLYEKYKGQGFNEPLNPKMVTLQVPEGSLILTPNDSSIICRIKFNNWMDEKSI